MKQLLRSAFCATACLWLALASSGEPGQVHAAVAADRELVSAGGAWELIRDEEGIRTYRMEQPGSPLLAFKGEGVIDAPIDVVLSVCLDAERAGEWIGLVSESLVLRWIDGNRAYDQLTRFDLPWPVRDRVFVSRVELDIDPESHAATLAYHESEDVPPIDDAIVGSTSGTHFVLRPIDGGTRTFFSGIGIADPRGAIPVWFVNWAGRSIPHRTLRALREQVGKDDVAVLPVVESLYAGFDAAPRGAR